MINGHDDDGDDGDKASLIHRERKHRKHRDFPSPRIISGRLPVAILAVACISLVYFATVRCNDRLVVPQPVCRSNAWCVHDYVRLNDRVWSPPPLWTVEDYLDTFPVIATANSTAAGHVVAAQDLQFLVTVGSDTQSSESAQSIEDTWGEQELLNILYLGGKF